MQFGHLGIALAIASIDPRPETFAVVTAAQFLPNADSLLIRAGWARPEFHGTWSHSLPFCAAVGALAAGVFGPWLGVLALGSIVLHVVADLPTDTGIPLLLPLDRKSTRLNSSHSQISYAVFCLKKKKTNAPWESLGEEMAPD